MTRVHPISSPVSPAYNNAYTDFDNRRWTPGTIEFTQDLLEHQRSMRKNPKMCALEYGTYYIASGAMSGVLLLALPWWIKRGYDQGQLRPPNPRSLHQDVFFHKKLCDRDTSARWIKCLKDAGVIQRGRNRVVKDVRPELLDDALLRMQASNHQVKEEREGKGEIYDGPLNMAHLRQHIDCILAEQLRESKRIDKLTGEQQRKSWEYTQAAVWAGLYQGLSLCKAVSPEAAQRRVTEMKQLRAELDNIKRNKTGFPSAPTTLEEYRAAEARYGMMHNGMMMRSAEERSAQRADAAAVATAEQPTMTEPRHGEPAASAPISFGPVSPRYDELVATPGDKGESSTMAMAAAAPADNNLDIDNFDNFDNFDNVDNVDNFDIDDSEEFAFPYAASECGEDPSARSPAQGIISAADA